MKIFEIITEARPRNDELIQKVKDLWDRGITSTSQIASELGLTKNQVSMILVKYYPNRTNKQVRTEISTELIQKIKYLWDNGIASATQIALELGLSTSQVKNILHRYYPNRTNKQEKPSPELIQQVKDLWDRGMRSPKRISAELGITKNRAEGILHVYYPNRPSKLEHGEVPRNLMPSIISMYKNGQSISSITKLLDINASSSGMRYALKQLPNWEEIRAEHLANKPIRKQNVATTDIHRSGTIGNRRSKGYGSRHTAGVDWPKYG